MYYYTIGRAKKQAPNEWNEWNFAQITNNVQEWKETCLVVAYNPVLLVPSIKKKISPAERYYESGKQVRASKKLLYRSET